MIDQLQARIQYYRDLGVRYSARTTGLSEVALRERDHVFVRASARRGAASRILDAAAAADEPLRAGMIEAARIVLDSIDELGMQDGLPSQETLDRETAAAQRVLTKASGYIED